MTSIAKSRQIIAEMEGFQMSLGRMSMSVIEEYIKTARGIPQYEQFFPELDDDTLWDAVNASLKKHLGREASDQERRMLLDYMAQRFKMSG